ncbi:PH domain-containing protein [Mycobacteroides abscessus]|uniref:PH domain-containing protein n=1 Tax=Mycobacteroides abscessus TaxID=36809 RepID=UPI00138FA5C8|nr:PH domain-containing protein [Mycobacteroides abscessus]
MISHVATPMLFVAPANRLGPNARTLWIVQGIANYLVVIAFIVGVGFFAPGRFWWWSLAAVVGILAVPYVIVRSYLRLRVHRWEFNEVALYVQTGWITHVRTIIPIQRIKKITEQRGLLQRKFGLSSLTISAGSGAGTINIDNIDHLVAAEIANKSAIATAPDTDE